MVQVLKTWLALSSDRRGVTALEYALMGGIVVAVILFGVSAFADDLAARITYVDVIFRGSS